MGSFLCDVFRTGRYCPGGQSRQFKANTGLPYMFYNSTQTFYPQRVDEMPPFGAEAIRLFVKKPTLCTLTALSGFPPPGGSSLMVGFIFLDTAPAQRARLHAAHNEGRCEGRPPYLAATAGTSLSPPGWISLLTSDKGEASNDASR